MPKLSEMLSGPKMEVNKPYQYRWRDGAVVKFKVTNVSSRHIDVTFDNGVENRFSVGSPMHKECVPC